jgi:hypothetical protein
LSASYCQCPVCYSVYHPVTEEGAKKHMNKYMRYYKQMRQYQKDLFYTKFKTIDLFKYCHYCGTSHTEFIEATDLHSNPLVYVSPIIFEKNVDNC